MAYDSVRAQLDKLLGADRNGPLANATAEPISYTDQTVCKGYLLGFCPNDLYIKYRSEPGSCPKQHLLAVREAFEKDRADGKACADAARWTRDLFNECRSILDDEERRIRAHARRLQDSYGANGPLTGLMIRSFDTLKKLGMVSQHAKIRILSELDDLDDAPRGDDDSLNRNPKTDNVEAKANVEASMKNVSVPTDDAKSSSEKDSSTKDDDNNEDDDDDDFGVISVIPAAGSGSEARESQTAQGTEPEDSDKGKAEATTNGLTQNGKTSADKPISVQSEAAKTASLGEQKNADGKDNSVRTNSDEPKGADTASTELNMTTSASVEEEDKMEEFYQKGTGPDGLVMLTRKQCLRVCACCGGFISLVDAESRLLSHYGGKSHHSLVQLREKVAELERTVASERRFPRDASPRDYQRGRRVDSETNWSRGDERRPRRWDSRDRYRGRRERDADDGYGSSDRRRGSYYHRDERGGGDRDYRSRYDARNDEDRSHGRYGYDRKRYRSRSPVRSNRRQRYRY